MAGANGVQISGKRLIYMGTSYVMAAEYQKLKGVHRSLQQQNSSLQTELDKARLSLICWNNPSLDSPDARVREYCRVIAKCQKQRKEIQQLEQDKKDLRAQLNELKREHIKEMKGRLDAVSKYRESQKEIRRLTNECDRLKQERDTIAAQLDEVQNELAKKDAALNNDGTTSGISSRKTPIGKDKPKPRKNKSKRSKGGQPGHTKSALAQAVDEAVTDHKMHYPEAFASQLDEDGNIPPGGLFCPKCGNSLPPEDMIDRTKELIDIETTTVVTRNHFITITCPSCGTVFWCRIPRGLAMDAQYGENIKVFVCLMLNLGFVSINRVQALIKQLFKLKVSQGWIAKMNTVLGDLTEEFSTKLKFLFRCFTIIQWDDTVVFANGKQITYRAYITQFLSLFVAREKKDLAGLIDDGILTSLTVLNRVVHDHNTINYNEEFLFLHAECCQHLLRDLEKLVVNYNCAWAKGLSAHLSSLINERNTRFEKGEMTLPEPLIAEFNQKLDEILASQSSLAESKIREHEQRQRELGNTSSRIFPPEKWQAQLRILRRLSNPVYREAYFAWMKDFHIPVTNNATERSFRNEKTHMNVSGQFDSVKTASKHASAMSYIKTCEKNGVDPRESIARAFSGNPVTPEELDLMGKADLPAAGHPPAQAPKSEAAKAASAPKAGATKATPAPKPAQEAPSVKIAPAPAPAPASTTKGPAADTVAKPSDPQPQTDPQPQPALPSAPAAPKSPASPQSTSNSVKSPETPPPQTGADPGLSSGSAPETKNSGPPS